MKYLNLVNIEKSDIKYKISQYPDGQNQITLDPLIQPTPGDWNNEVYKLSGGKVTIKAHLNNFIDLEKIICATKSLRELGVKEIHLYTPYFLGSRSDRKFEEGSNNYLKDVICPIINSLNFESVTVLNPHSDVLEACLNNFKKVDNKDLINYSLSHYTHGIYNNKNSNERTLDKFILISPDAGANKKIFKVAEQIGYTGEIITCSKSRDENGKLSNVIVPYDESLGSTDKDLIIIDDICDGGATFLNIAKAIKKTELFYGKIYLIVTHGIFSKGFKELNQYFDGIYCTNSYSDLNSPEMSLKYDNTLHKVKQLNVF